jgi:serine/threonine protein kinase
VRDQPGSGSVLDTVAYMSPEQVRGDPVPPASDVFSLGSVLAFAATGRPPFGSDTAATVMFRIVNLPPDLAGLDDDGLRSLIEACLAKPPGDRPEVLAILAACDFEMLIGVSRCCAQSYWPWAAGRRRCSDGGLRWVRTVVHGKRSRVPAPTDPSARRVAVGNRYPGGIGAPSVGRPVTG